MNPPDSLKALAPDALTALESTEISRRTFMKRSGVLIVGFSMAGLPAGLGMVPSRASAQGVNGPGSDQLDSWIAIGADGSVTAYTGKCELGHGLYTAQTQLIAEAVLTLDRLSQPLSYRKAHDQDQRTDDHSQQRQRRAHFLLPEGRQRQSQ